ncbi:hypothetical protein SLS53_004238 [Cytospora paraplurivora]|uniref:Carrier domain-containing protein n=1 Tax=Cytospora paraplurivora TaxID=2898453 RepID=A0AAN9UGN7_9PEZI
MEALVEQDNDNEAQAENEYCERDGILHISRDMGRSGAKNLMIMSRSGTDADRSRRVLRDLASLGVTAKIAREDVTTLQDVTRVFRESDMPIKGIVQGAMVLRDKTFESMTPQEYHEALACKVTGTWNLHNAAEEHIRHKLDFFTMLSSVSGVVGTAGQANYAAGNSFQDAFAQYRHSLGLAAHTVDLGIIEDVGYMSEHQGLTDRVQSRSQLSGINERQLHEILRLSLIRQTLGPNPKSAPQMVTGLPFPLSQDSPLLRDMRFHSLLVPQHSQDADIVSKSGENGDTRAFQGMVKAQLPAEKILPEAVKLVNKQIVRILGLSSDMEETKPLNSYGLDSLAAVDLRNWFKLRLRVELTTLDILNAASLRTLCTKAVGRLLEASQC